MGEGRRENSRAKEGAKMSHVSGGGHKHVFILLRHTLGLCPEINMTCEARLSDDDAV